MLSLQVANAEGREEQQDTCSLRFHGVGNFHCEYGVRLPVHLRRWLGAHPIRNIHRISGLLYLDDQNAAWLYARKQYDPIPEAS